MKFREVFLYEIEYRLRSRSTWLYAAILFGLPFLLLVTANQDGPLNVNAPQSLATLAIGLSAFALVISAALFGDAAVRDPAAGMDPLVYTTSLRRTEYLGGRFVAALSVNAIVLLAIPLGLAAAMLVPAGNPSAHGPFRVAAYWQPYVFLLLPNLLFSGAVLFTIGVLARNVVPVYLGAIGLLISYLLAGNYLSQLDNPLVTILADPLGINTLNRLTEYWTVAEKNVRLIGLPSDLIWNRVAWVTLAAVAFALMRRRFHFKHPDDSGRRVRSVMVGPKPALVAVPTVAKSFSFGTTARQMLAVARNAFTEVVATRSFALVLLATIALTVLWGHNVGSTLFDTVTWPVTMLVAEAALSIRVLPIIYLLIALYAGELVWKERESGVAEIADAAPVSAGVALLGRFLALVSLLALIQAAITMGGIVIQASQGYYDFEIGLYLRIMFGLNLTNFVLLAALAMAIHVVVNHKYIGHIVVLGAFAHPFIARDTDIPLLMVQHHLLLYGTDPGWTYSDMNGFGPFIEPFVWFKLYWGAWAVLFGVVASVLWVRGRESGLRRRFSQARARFTGPLLRTAGVAFVLITLFGGFIFYNTNVLNDYATPDERGASQAAYEKRYGRFENVAQPTIESASLRVEIYPDEQAVDMRGSYRLVNKTNEPIDSVHVYVEPAIETRAMSFDRGAVQVVEDGDVGYRIYRLGQTLQPGEAMQLSFDVGYRQRGFPNSNVPTSLVNNGASFDRRWMPFIGYQPMFELTHPEARQRFGLGPRPQLPGPAERGPRRYREPFHDADVVQVDMVIGTSADQIANTPGVLQKEWTQNGRRYFRYVTEIPASFGATVVSGRYAVVEDRWRDVALSIFHHPDHDYNLDAFRRGMKAALEYFTNAFGPYQFSQLRIVEIPRYNSGGHAHPYITAFSEDNFITRSQENEFDQTFFGTAHEVAHSWWGGQVASASDVSGGQGFPEALANYSAMLVTAKTFGPDAARKVYDFQMNRYLSRRATQARDVPLLEAYDQPWIAYGKGAVALYTLRDMIGEERVNAALRTFLDKHRAGVPPYPTSYDLLAELRAVTPDTMRYLLTDLFETVTLWEVEAESAAVERLETGEYLVTLAVTAKKLRADSVGNETAVPMNDFVEIGVFAAGGAADPGEPLYLQRHRIVTGRQTIAITVPREPVRAGIDPHHKLIDRTRDNNVVAVEVAGRRGS